MGLFDSFRKSAREKRVEEAHRRAMKEELEVYSGMRVEVTSGDGRVFLVAKLLELRGDRAQLEPGVDGSLMSRSEEPLPVTLRGYSSLENRTVLLEGTIRMGPSGLWQAEHLALKGEEEQRANIRVNTELEGSYVLPDRAGVPEERCQVNNMGMGGVCVGAQSRRDVGDKFLLRINQLLELRDTPLLCQVLRIDTRRAGYFEYGCRFVELDEETERRLFRAMYALYHGLY